MTFSDGEVPESVAEKTDSEPDEPQAPVVALAACGCCWDVRDWGWTWTWSCFSTGIWRQGEEASGRPLKFVENSCGRLFLCDPVCSGW